MEQHTLGIMGGPAAEGPAERICVYCGPFVGAWIPYRLRATSSSEFLHRARMVGSNVERFKCPQCGSTDRERHLRLYLERLDLLGTIPGRSVLHMAPEPRLGALIESLLPSRYVTGDLMPTRDTIQQLDLEHLPFPDGTFDIVVFNHMLEHVASPTTALSEVHRVLTPGGRSICQTPFAARLTRTLDEPLLQSESDRLFFYGQEDHIRLFGRDLPHIINRAGFAGRLVAHDELLAGLDPEQHGINEHEPFFDFVRA